MGSKKASTYLTMAVFFLAGGIEYSVIFPTMWNYIQHYDGEQWLYGLSLAAFSISNLVTAPLYGLMFDKTHKTKLIVLFANLFEIGGNFMYFSASSKYMILGSRFIVGLGAGAGATIVGELSRTTNNKVRTAVFSVFMGMRQIGLVLGPAFNLFLGKCHFSLGPFEVNNLTSPGAFMAVVWIVVELLFLFLFFSLPDISKPPSSEADRCPSPIHHTINSAPAQHTINSTRSEGSLLPKSPAQHHIPQPHVQLKWSERVWHLIREEPVVLLAVVFVTMFNQTGLEAKCVPMAQDLLLWSEKDLSLFYSGAGIVIIVAFVVVFLLSFNRCFQDRWQLLGGLLIELTGFLWMVGLLGQATQGTAWILWRFLVGAFFSVFGLPFVFVSGTSLYSKLLPNSIQGFGQGVRRSTLSLAAIMGPLWAGGSGTKGDLFSNYYVWLAIPCGLLFLVLVLVILSITKLKEPQHTT